MEPFVRAWSAGEQVEHARRSCRACSRTWITRMSSRSPIGSARSGCRCSGSSAFPDGTTSRCVRSWSDRWAGNWAKMTASSSSILRLPKSGRDSVGVARQWCGRLGKVEICQVAVFMGYVSSEEHALVDTRLFSPKSGPRTRHAARRPACPRIADAIARGISCAWKCWPSTATRSRTGGLPATSSWPALRVSPPFGPPGRAVLVGRAVEHVDPRPRCGRAVLRRSRSSAASSVQRVDAWRRPREEDEWTEIDVRDGAKGPLSWKRSSGGS